MPSESLALESFASLSTLFLLSLKIECNLVAGRVTDAAAVDVGKLEVELER